MKKIGVIGLGNPLRRDDGIGIILLEQLQKQKKEFPKNVEFIDGGTGGMTLLHIFVGFEIVLIIDAVDFKGRPGDIRLFTLDEIYSRKAPVRLSTHESDFIKVLQLSKELNELPSKLFVFGIQPTDVSHGIGLSKELTTVLNNLLKKLTQEIYVLTE
jgi:hydrogenase maturation protease